MVYEVKLRTGYFQTSQYNMVIADNQILLASTTGRYEDIRIMNIDLIVVSSEGKRNRVLEIQSNDIVYSCILHKDTDLDVMLSTLRKELNVSKGIVINS